MGYGPLSPRPHPGSTGAISSAQVIDVSRTTDWDKDVSSVAEHRQRLNGTAYLDGFFFDRVPHNEQKLRDLMDVIAQHIDQANRSACIAERMCTHINHADQKVFLGCK